MSGGIVLCPDCDARQVVERGDAGRLVICWRCGERFRAPGDRPTSLYRGRRRARLREEGDFNDESPRRRQPPPAVSPAAVIAFVMGVVSCVMACAWPASLCTSVAGLVTAGYGVGTPSRKLAVAGGVLSAVGLTFALGFLVLTVAGVSVFDPANKAKPTPFFPSR